MRPLFELFKTADIVASSDVYPFEPNKMWKRPTLCIGVSLFKATKATGVDAYIYNTCNLQLLKVHCHTNM